MHLWNSVPNLVRVPADTVQDIININTNIQTIEQLLEMTSKYKTALYFYHSISYFSILRNQRFSYIVPVGLLYIQYCTVCTILTLSSSIEALRFLKHSYG